MLDLTLCLFNSTQYTYVSEEKIVQMSLQSLIGAVVKWVSQYLSRGGGDILMSQSVRTVCILAPEDLPIPPTRGGSVQIYIHSVAKQTARILTKTANSIPSNPNIQPIIISPATINMKRNSSTPYPHIRLRGPADSYLAKAIQHLKTLYPDIIQIENRPKWIPIVREAFPTAKIILNLHSKTFLKFRSYQKKSSNFPLIYADSIICNSQYLANYVQNLNQSYIPEKISKPAVRVIYPGVDLNDYRQNHPHSLHSPLRLLFVGRVISQKGVHLLIAAMNQLVQQKIPVQLKIVGRTPPWEESYRKRIQGEICRHRLPVQMVGFVQPGRLTPYYQNADILLCPSQITEAFGLVNVEALACGLPIIASRLGGIREIVTKEVGLLVNNYKSSTAFAEAIMKINRLSSYEYEQLSIHAKKRAAFFTWKKTAQDFQQVYSQLHS